MPFKQVTNWGNFPRVAANIGEADNISDARKFVCSQSGGVVARGNGRCYGDSSLGENIFSTLKLNKFLALDVAAQTIECEAGVLFADILQVIVPQKLFLPITPGTKFITVGGAIAADVHGKNHHVAGSFAKHLISFELLTADGATATCSPTENADLFWQTCGGMGLTGIILTAKFRLQPIETAFIRQTSYKARNLADVMELFEQHAAATYSVAWIDCLIGGARLGRSILMLGEHARPDELPLKLRSNPLALAPDGKLNVPFYFPAVALNQISVKAFNFAYYNRLRQRATEAVVHFDKFFYPLDGIHNWNRIYGRRGFVQYQFVLPKAASAAGLPEILRRIERAGQGSFLAVLKLFGAGLQQAPMSFPREGYTLALDFKVNRRVFALLDELDQTVEQHGGRVYLAKDARMNAAFYRRTYPRRAAAVFFQSAQSKRLSAVSDD